MSPKSFHTSSHPQPQAVATSSGDELSDDSDFGRGSRVVDMKEEKGGDKVKGASFVGTDEHAFHGASVWQRMTYSFATPMLKHGFRQPLKEENLPPLADRDKAGRMTEVFSTEWEKEMEKEPSQRSIWRPIYRSSRDSFWLSAFWCACEVTARLLQPYFLGKLIWWLRSDEVPEELQDDGSALEVGIAFAAGLVLSNLFQLVAHHALFMITMRWGWNMKTAITGSIHQKALRANTSSLMHTTTGQTVNLVSNDVERFVIFSPFVHFLWSSPTELLIVTAILISHVGVPATFAGLGVLLLIVPVSMVMSRQFGKRRAVTASFTDKRVRLTAEIVSGIASVKSFAWEEPFGKAIADIRRGEFRSIFKSTAMKACNLAMFFAAPVLTSFVTFATYISMGNELTPETVFTVLSFLHVARLGMTSLFVRGMEGCGEARVSFRRLQRFLELPEVSGDRCHNSNGQTTGVEIDSALFSWGARTESERDGDGDGDGVEDSRKKRNGQKSEFTVGKINLSVAPGQLVGVIGPVGSGKSSLLDGILGEMECVEGKVAVNGNIAFAGQKPWIKAGTLRDNILFGLPFDSERYEEVIQACSLTQDLNQLNGGDTAEIGEKGVNLSGGQKARVALARALYADADVYLLDDPLSAVDPAVSRHLFHKCIKDALQRKGKVVILVTHQLQYLQEADSIVALDTSGDVAAQGSFSELQQQGLDLSKYLSSGDSSVDDLVVPEEKKPTALSKLKPTKKSVAESKKGATDVSVVTVDGAAEDVKKKKTVAHSLIEAEEQNVGKVTMRTYWSYISDGGVKGLAFVVLLLCFIAQSAIIITDLFLIQWVVDRETDGGASTDDDDSEFIGFFAAMTFGTALLGFSRSLTYFYSALRASSRLHNGMFKGVLRSPMTFFYANPTGRILNKFSKDQGIIDELLPVSMFDFLQSVFLVTGAFVIMCTAIPWLIIIVLPMVIGFIRIRRFFLASSREVKRMEAVTRSPIYAEFGSTLNGLSTIRAFGAADRVQSIFIKRLDENGQKYISFVYCARWVGFRLDVMCNVILTVMCIFAVALRGFVDSGLVGLALVYSLSMSGLFQYAVRQSAEVENFMTGVERVLYYSRLAPEPSPQPPPASSKRVTKEWPRSGELSLEGLSVRYRQDLPSVLKNVTLAVGAGEKVGVVGRTGSGKSSMALALYRLNQLPEGRIVVDGVDTASIPLEQLRSKLSFIPQDPVLFSGTLRFNLDPFREYDDSDIQSALKAVQLGNLIPMLHQDVAENGENLSVGQRQLVSLARAILRRNRIVVMDEATANVDYDTDALIQRTVRESDYFKDCTVMTIAHRLDTVIDYDKIIVLSDGNLVEFDSPQNLLANRSSLFSQMVDSSSQSERLRKIALKQ